MRHWSAANPSEVIACEYCTAHATYMTSLIDDDGLNQEMHFHCDPHGDDVIALLNSRRREGQRWIVEERHWMHIWKAGFKQCVSCRADSRFVATRLDDEGNVIAQELYCTPHAPQGTEPYVRTGEASDIERDLIFCLGGSYPVTLNDSDAEIDEQN